MRNLKLPDYIELLLRLMIGGTFIYASIDKIFHPDAFALSIFHYRLVPGVLLHPLAMYLPFLEFFTGAALIAGKFINRRNFVCPFQRHRYIVWLFWY